MCQLVLEDLSQERVRIEGTEARHALASLRGRPGVLFAATDGRGTRAQLEILRVGGKGAEAVVRRRERIAPPARRWWLATAAAGPRLDWLVEKAVELGTWGMTPLAGRGGAAAVVGKRAARWERLARAALGQCLGSWAMRISPPRPLEDLLRSGPEEGVRWSAVVWGDPHGRPAAAVSPLGLPEGDVLLAIGPPDGFSNKGLAALGAARHAFGIRLGERRLRSETAALAILVWAALGGEGSVKARQAEPLRG